MAINWITPAGDLGTYEERIQTSITLDVESDVGDVTLSVISGELPGGMVLLGNKIFGSPIEVPIYTTKTFVIRASDGSEIKDRTFSINIDGADFPEWITEAGFLNVGPGDAFFIRDDSEVNFELNVTGGTLVDVQLQAEDDDAIAGQTLSFYLVPNSGELPPGLTLSKAGKISGFTEPTIAIDYDNDPTGAYDSQSFDTVPLDIALPDSNGYDSFFYDNQTFDYNEPSRSPKRLSRIYTFTIAITDGLVAVARTFKIYVVSDEFLKADNNILKVDTNLFQADATDDRIPLWISNSYLGRYRANNYISVPLEVYDPPTLAGTIGFFQVATNEDGSPSELPPGMELDVTTGYIAGKVAYQNAITETYKFTIKAVNFDDSLADVSYEIVGDWSSKIKYAPNQAVRFQGFVWICKEEHINQPPEKGQYWIEGVGSVDKEFTIDIIGEIDSAITWISDTNLGVLKPSIPSRAFVEAKSELYGGRVSYELESGKLPPGLSLSSTGIIQGVVNQFGDSDADGLTRFYDVDSSLEESTGTRSFDTTFDQTATSFDRTFTFDIKAIDGAKFAESVKSFTLSVEANTNKTFADMYIKMLQPKNKRLNWFNFITDVNIFPSGSIYRYGDPYFGVQTIPKMLLFGGIESKESVNYVQALSRNFYNKRFLLGDVKVASAKDTDTQETIYEVIYVEIKDELESQSGKSISSVVDLSDRINSKVLVSYDAISVDSDIPFVSDADHQRVFPNSVKNMRDRIKDVGQRDRDFLPLWMRTIQEGQPTELGYTKALVLCYCKPGESNLVYNNILNSNFKFANLDFEADRVVINILDGEIQDKYLVFPQRGEKLP